jgi:hypothetical protein
MSECSEYKVVEITNGAWDNDGDPIISDSWNCDSYNDAVLERAGREVEHIVQGLSDCSYEVTDDGEIVTDIEAPESDDVFARVHGWGYEPREILSAMGEAPDVSREEA